MTHAVFEYVATKSSWRQSGAWLREAMPPGAEVSEPKPNVTP
jgi:hypothetical protein